ncbi:Lipooligosaccharide biosynthesis protein lex-1 [Moraxella caprae]|uniref:Lipooligosaccharide biosynthesis protein lex-1 n=1 Tax=Moraxella caprae TaxID=90240 RepID=A0A378R224_9GAMM|nr:glycosyltransferase family 25 protein [Moraxella caprae]STZ08829.1 Lipooligosaccharide biosynthesis protein lex-1 [Moraxella caprae]
MKNYVISLATATDRRQHIITEFGKQNIDFEFFDAITPNYIDEYCTKFNLTLANTIKLSGGEKACFLSHVSLWQKMIDDNLDYIAVFEDDVYLGNNAHVFFNDDNWLKDTGIDYLKTETFLQERKLSQTIVNLPDKRTAQALNEYHLGTAGYILSQKGALSLLTYIKSLSTDDYLPIDQLMFDNYMNHQNALPIYQLLPAVVAQEFILYPTQNTMPSDIKSSRDERVKNKPKRTLLQKIKGELGNAYRKTFGKFSRTLINFQ